MGTKALDTHAKRVIVLGSANIDLVVNVVALPAPGETVLGDRLVTVGGGKGANQAVAAARLGASVQFIGRVGGDGFGTLVMEGLAADLADLSSISKDPIEPTGVALIVVDDDGQNTVTVAPGANFQVGEAEVAILARSLKAGDVVVLQLEVPLNAVRAAIEAAREAHALVILNAAPAGGLPGQSLPQVDLLVVNEAEAALLSGIDVRDIPSATRAAAGLRNMAAAVVVTLGPAGAVLWSDGAAAHVAGTTVRAVDATAAGDAFVGAVAYAMSQGMTLARAVEMGNRAGAATVTRMGARSSLPTAAELR